MAAQNRRYVNSTQTRGTTDPTNQAGLGRARPHAAGLHYPAVPPAQAAAATTALTIWKPAAESISTILPRRLELGRAGSLELQLDSPLAQQIALRECQL